MQLLTYQAIKNTVVLIIQHYLQYTCQYQATFYRLSRLLDISWRYKYSAVMRQQRSNPPAVQ